MRKLIVIALLFVACNKQESSSPEADVSQYVEASTKMLEASRQYPEMKNFEITTLKELEDHSSVAFAAQFLHTLEMGKALSKKYSKETVIKLINPDRPKLGMMNPDCSKAFYMGGARCSRSYTIDAFFCVVLAEMPPAAIACALKAIYSNWDCMETVRDNYNNCIRSPTNNN